MVDFQDRTKLSYVLIFPVMHKVAVKLFVEDFGIAATLKHYESLVAAFTSEGTIRESQFKSFGWPDVPSQDVPRANEFDAQLWKRSRDLIARGILKETIASALVNTALRGASGLDPLLSVGFLIITLKDLRTGVYTPPPEVRPEVTEGTEEATTAIFKGMRDLAYEFKEHSGLEWQHLLPGIQRVCVIYCIKYRGRDRVLELFLDQVRLLQPLLDECPKNSPQQLQLTPQHITNMAEFDEVFLRLSGHVYPASRSASGTDRARPINACYQARLCTL